MLEQWSCSHIDGFFQNVLLFSPQRMDVLRLFLKCSTCILQMLWRHLKCGNENNCKKNQKTFRQPCVQKCRENTEFYLGCQFQQWKVSQQHRCALLPITFTFFCKEVFESFPRFSNSLLLREIINLDMA